MSRYFARIFRALFVSSVGVGGGVALMIFIWMIVLQGHSAPKFALITGLSVGAVFAIFFVAVRLPLDVASKLFLSKMQYKEIWELKQERDLEFNGSYKDAVILCRQALVALPHAQRVNQDTENSLVFATIGSSWRSSGEHMEVKITPIADDKWLLCSSSEPLSTSVVFDYGKNFDNVVTFAEQFASVAKERASRS